MPYKDRNKRLEYFYLLLNKEIIKNNKKEYNEENKDKIKNNKKEYFEENKDKIKISQKEWKFIEYNISKRMA